MTEASAPLTPADCDLRDFPFTPIFRARLFGSSFHARATDAEWRAGVTLWLKSWDQVPAGSLPDDDIDLCRLAELGRDHKTWAKIKDGAMRGWIKCTDGRLYHPVVAEGVLEAWDRRRKQSARGKAGASKKWHKDDATAIRPPMQPPSKNYSASMPKPMLTPSPENGASMAQAMLSDSKGQGQGQGERQKKDSEAIASGAGAPAEPELLQPLTAEMPDIPGFLDRRADPPDPKKIIFDQGLAWLSERTNKPPDRLRSYLGKLCRDHGDAMTSAAIVDAQKNSPVDPISWMERFLNGKQKSGDLGQRRSLAAAFLGADP